MHKSFILILAFTLLFVMGCDRDSDGGSTTFIDNGTEGAPVVGIPAPTPFTPSPSVASLDVDVAELSIAGGTTHTFTVTISNVAGTGSLAASNITAGSSGSVTGLPLAVNFSALAQIGPATFVSTGAFSGPICGPGTVNVLLIYSESDNSVARTEIFSVSAGGSCPGAGGGGGGGGGGAPPPMCTPVELIEHDETFESAFTGIGCAAPQGLFVEFTAPTTPFSITSIRFFLAGDPPIADLDFVVFSAASLASEVARETVPGTSGASGEIIYTLTTPVVVPGTTFYAGLEAATAGNDFFLGFDTTAPTPTSFVYGSDPGCDPLIVAVVSLVDFGIPGNVAIAVTGCSMP